MRLLNWSLKLLSANAEILLHRNFGRRYLPILTASFLAHTCCILIMPFPNPLRSLVFLVMAVRFGVHCKQALTRRRRGIPEPHSQSTGEPWSLWQDWRIDRITIERYLEPALLVITSFVCSTIDPFLDLWLKGCGASLFLKNILGAVRLRRRVMDAADNRFEAEDLSVALNRYLHPRERRARNTHRAQLADRRTSLHGERNQ